MNKKFYITTPLYYVNAEPHIGHSYTNIAADCLARFYRLKGREVYFLTGTDEHGEKIERSARNMGKKDDVGSFVDSIVPAFKKLWAALSISYDDFIRTTEPRHERTVQHMLRLLYEKGDIYEDVYEGWYCTPCEMFWRGPQVEGRACPDCKRALEEIREKNYFFRISKYQRWLIEHIRKNPYFIRPESRYNETLSFLEGNALQDLCISRPKDRLSWGIEVPFDRDYVTYVWFDALINYVSAAGFGVDENRFGRLWPADLHIIGKDILRQHAIYWPIMLRAAGVSPPERIFAHGWWIIKGEKMSKSKGNIVNPIDVISVYGVDAYRYFLLREVPFGSDGSFSEEGIVARFNNDLANDLGNLVNRTLVMVEKYFEGVIYGPRDYKKEPAESALDSGLLSKARELPAALESNMAELNFSAALTAVWALINAANKYIENAAPWKASKAGRRERLKEIIYSVVEVLRIVNTALAPFMPATVVEIQKQLDPRISVDSYSFDDLSKWGLVREGTKIKKGPPLFPRIKQ